jgi:hypothetical protein
VHIFWYILVKGSRKLYIPSLRRDCSTNRQFGEKKVKKSFAILLTAILLLSTFAFIAPVRASTGHPLLGTTDSGVLTLADSSISIKAGAMAVSMVDGVPATGNFTIVFQYNETLLVDFSGAVFDLYLSKDGYSSLSADDKMYAGSFSVADLSLSGLKQVNVTNALLKGGTASFYIGTVTSPVTAMVLIGPVPFDITNDYKYVKVFDGTGTLVAVTGIVNILASLSLTPTSGPGGAYVCLSGVALAANTVYNITYSGDTDAAAQVTTGADGKFNFCWNIEDLCKVYNDGDSETITIEVWKYNGSFVDSVDFTEMYRVFLSFYSDYDGTYTGPYGNNSITMDVHIFDDFTVEGNWFNPTGPVVITVDGITLASVTTNASGYFTTTFTIPILAIENHTVKVSNVGCNLFFEIWVYPTLVVTPEEGPIGTEVTFSAYGFPANIPVYLYWEVDQSCNYDYCYLWIANTTTGSDGTFNVTTTWVIPKMPGGWHDVEAMDTFYFENQTCDCCEEGTFYSWDAEIAWTSFYVTPTLWVTPSSFANDGTTFFINGSGFDPALTYVINLDNQAYSVPSAGYFSNDYWAWWDYGTGYPYAISQWVYNPSSSFVVSDLCGDLSIQMVAAGFRPGLHAVSLTASAYNDYWMYFDFYGNISPGSDMYPSDHWWYGTPANDYATGVNWNLGFYPTDVYATFTVTTEGDLVVGDITANTTATLNSINAKILSIEDDVATLTTDVGQLKVSVSALDAKVVALQGSVATVQTTLGTMTGTLTSVAGDMATVKTQVGTINANVASVKSFLPVDMMPVWIAVIFAIIAAIASIYGVLVIRSKIAQ